MEIVRTDEEAALQHLLTSVQRSNEYLLDTASCIDDSLLSNVLLRLAERRQTYLPKLEEAVRASGDLPMAKDPERTLCYLQVKRAGAALSPGEWQSNYLVQRMNGEKELLKTIKSALQENKLIDSSRAVLLELQAHVSRSLRYLEDVLLGLQH